MARQQHVRTRQCWENVDHDLHSLAFKHHDFGDFVEFEAMLTLPPPDSFNKSRCRLRCSIFSLPYPKHALSVHTKTNYFSFSVVYVHMYLAKHVFIV